jgi:potassium channel subfamily K, other eukaryote
VASFTRLFTRNKGFGDIQLTSTGSKVFTCFYAIIGIINVGLAVGLTRETVIESLEIGYRRRVHAMREARQQARWRRRVTAKWKAAVEWRLKEAKKEIWVPDAPKPKATLKVKLSRLLPWKLAWFSSKSPKYLGHVPHPHGMHFNLEGLEVNELEAAAVEIGIPLGTLLPPEYWMYRSASEKSNQMKPEEMPETHKQIGQMLAMVGSFALAVNHSNMWFLGAHHDGDPESSNLPTLREENSALPMSGREVTQGGKRKTLVHQYDDFRVTMEREESAASRARIIVALLIFILFWVIGSVIFMKTEQWTFGIAVYFCEFVVMITLACLFLL